MRARNDGNKSLYSVRMTPEKMPADTGPVRSAEIEKLTDTKMVSQTGNIVRKNIVPRVSVITGDIV